MTQSSEKRSGPAWRSRFRLCALCLLAIGASCLAPAYSALAATELSEKYRSIEAKIDGHYGPLMEKSPRDASVPHRWAYELDRLAVRIARDKTSNMYWRVPIMRRAAGLYARAAELEPANPKYAKSLAMEHISLVEDAPAITGGMREEPLLSAGRSFETADRLTKGDSNLRRYWAETLSWTASKERTSPDPALEMLAEADRVFALLVGRPPEEKKKGRSNAEFWEKRGEAAVFAAWRAVDVNACRQALNRAREYFARYDALTKHTMPSSWWIMALDPEDKPLRDPAYADILRRECLDVLREFNPSVRDGARENKLCFTLEWAAAYEKETEAQNDLLREARPYCATALESSIPFFRKGMREVIERIDKRLAAP